MFSADISLYLPKHFNLYNMEEFRDIKGYEGKYQISNFGRVKSLKDSHGGYRERILNPIEHSQGYLTVILYKNGKIKNYKIHRLVAEVFIPNPNNYPCVNHKDENPSNNCVDNLEWCNHKYNINYGTCQHRRVANTDYKEVSRKRAEKLLNRKDQSKTVLQFTKDNEFVREWVSTKECGRNDYDHSAVAACCRGKLKSHKGFIWKYKE